MRYPTRSQSGKVAAIVGIALLILVVGGAAAWWGWMHSPRYAIQQMLRAETAHDLAAFEQVVDIPAVSAQLGAIGEARMKTAIQEKAGGGGGLLGGMLAKAAMSQMEGKVQGMVEEGIRERVSNGTFAWPHLAHLQSASVEELMQLAQGGVAIPCDGLASLSESGDTALATLKYHEPESGQSTTATLQMAHQSGTWRVVGVQQM